MAWLAPGKFAISGILATLYSAMTTLKTSQSASASSSARNALENREDFSLWAEAVKQQMLEALQKRQRS
jgi:hypothetical protein